MKKFLLLLLSAVMSISLIGCNNTTTNKDKSTKDGKVEKQISDTQKGVEKGKDLKDSNTENKNGDKVTGYTAKFGKVIEANKTDKKLTIKYKIDSKSNDKSTLEQNGSNVEDLILNQGGDKFNEIEYVAFTNMDNGKEEKVLSFTVDKQLIRDIKDKKVVGSQIVNKAKNVWISPSLKK